MKLKLLGYWQDKDRPSLQYPHPRDFIDPSWKPELRTKLGKYLKAGELCCGSWGSAYCRFEDGPPSSEMGSGELTDGVYVWPEGLHIYVERYNVVLPEEFVSHAESNQFKILLPKDLIAHMESLPFPGPQKPFLDIWPSPYEIDRDYWKEWTANYLAQKKRGS